MKRLLLVLLAFITFSTAPIWAGDPVTLPYYVIMGDPLTDKAERTHIKFYWDGAGAHCEFTYRVLNNDRTMLDKEYSVIISESELSDFTDGYASIMLTRANAIMSDHLQSVRQTQVK